MSETTVIDAEFEETEAIQVNLEDRVKKLEGLVQHLLKGRVSILKQFREMIAAVTEFSEESSEE
jgi:hypothetical protein|tara:strand:+ start:428 stop:619 length:192 start_codon:yes stop_codon:yes gene_type:complete